MFKKLLLSFAFLTLAVGMLQSQTWEPDYLSNSGVKIQKSGGKLGLVRFCGEGKTDSIPPIYDYIYKYQTRYGSLNILGMKDSCWYQINFKESPKQIPYKKYIGKGLFLEEKGKQTNLYSIERGLILIDTTNRFSKFLNNFSYYTCDEYLCFLEENNSSIYCFPTPDFNFNNINSYCLENIDILTLRDTKIKAKKNKANQTKYGLYTSYLYSDGPEILPCIYDSIFGENYCVFAKKGNIYEIYNGLNKRLPDSELPPTSYQNGFIDYTKNGKHGMMDYYGNTILECKYDKVWINKLLFAQLGDSLFCYNENKLIHSIKINSTSKINVNGEFDFQPFIVRDTNNNKSKTLFYYNSYSNKVLDLSSYDSSYFYDVFNDEYYVCVKKNKKYGIVNFDNKIVKAIEYDAIGKSLINGYWLDSLKFHTVNKNGKIGFISNSLKEYIPNEFDATSNINEESRVMPDKFFLRKGKSWYMYDFKTKQLFQNNFDTIFLAEEYRYYDSKVNQWITPLIASKNGETFYIDSTGKKYYDFKNIETRESENQVFLEEKKLNKTPINITPLATINRIEDFNLEHSYAIVFCLNRYFVINKYGEMSFGIENNDIYFDATNNYIYCKRDKKQKCAALYDFKGKEIGNMSGAKISYMEYDMTTNELYYLYVNKKGNKGLINKNGKSVLKDEYLDIGTINKGKSTVWKNKNDEPIEVDLLK